MKHHSLEQFRAERLYADRWTMQHGPPFPLDFTCVLGEVAWHHLHNRPSTYWASRPESWRPDDRQTIWRNATTRGMHPTRWPWHWAISPNAHTREAWLQS